MPAIAHLWPYGLTLGLMLMTGCTTPPSSQMAAGTRENGVLVLTRADHSRTAELRVGERLEVRLPENPSTGFRWAVEENDRRLLALDDTAYSPPEGIGFIGAQGVRRFNLTARQPGEAPLKLKYGRVWEGDGSVTDRFAVTLRILP